MTKKVLVGMSGGVDSSVAALLLLKGGYEVAGATFRLLDGDNGSGTEGSAADAAGVCKALGIAHHILDYRDHFRRHVTDYFAAEYRRGATPNPCVACNRFVKFGAFPETAREMGFDFIATGHYARVVYDGGAGRYRLCKGVHGKKDQSYVLYTLNQERLSRLLLPLGAYSKEEVRALAEENGLAVGRKAESQDICFVPDGDYAAFLEAYTGEAAPAGCFVDGDGNALGEHRGLWRYTIGQRRGLGMGFGRPLYVAAIDPASASVTLAGNDALMRGELLAGDLSLVDGGGTTHPLRCESKIRYAASPAPARVYPLEGGRVRVVFESPQRAVTAGQAVVFYDGDFVLGGATILKSL